MSLLASGSFPFPARTLRLNLGPTDVRTWEAAYAMRMYLTPQPPSSPSTLYFDPPCPLFAEPTSSPPPRRTIIEIGSGTGYLSIALAPNLAASDSLVLTDLEEVGPLLSSNLDTAKSRWTAQGRPVKAEVLVRSLPWGDEAALRTLVGPEEEGGEGKQADVVLASDLVYFPFLYPPLLRTLLGLTGMRAGKKPTQVLFSYKVRRMFGDGAFSG